MSQACSNSGVMMAQSRLPGFNNEIRPGCLVRFTDLWLYFIEEYCQPRHLHPFVRPFPFEEDGIYFVASTRRTKSGWRAWIQIEPGHATSHSVDFKWLERV